ADLDKILHELRNKSGLRSIAFQRQFGFKDGSVQTFPVIAHFPVACPAKLSLPDKKPDGEILCHLGRLRSPIQLGLKFARIVLVEVDLQKEVGYTGTVVVEFTRLQCSLFGLVEVPLLPLRSA